MNRQLKNPILTETLAEEIIVGRIERDSWYNWNMKALLENWRSGHVQQQVFANVASRLNRIANHRASV